MANKQIGYGGQAVIEGVMMGGKYTTVTAVRRQDRTIDFFECQKKNVPFLNKLKKIPVLRGIVAILESSSLGTKHLNFSSEAFEQKNEVPRSEEKKKSFGFVLGIAVLGILSFLFAKFVFTLVPAFLASFFSPIVTHHTGQILLEGFFKITLLLGYIYFVSLTPMMKRVFQYHGAEHKVINAFENNLPLSVENVKNASRLHYRCGSSFILFSAFISVALYFFVPTDPLWLRLLSRIALIPLDLGIAYEILRLTNRVRGIHFLKWLGYPGLWLQLLTTKEPDTDQIEVAIQAFEEMLKREAIIEGANSMVKNHVV
ncbi:DUF1385 domain-containing protein [Terrilactibacillus laevilacticus]|uniref:DUF1385 domain-containing protein n=1 Tax=Terrilactibacillus laevilacticus TaxID=1380157 RepID=UPI0011477601|nr:DUF1385 domain-containing protein [Terrilactibacillus laevilacticus]